MKIVWCTRGSVRGTRLIYIISHQGRFLWKNARYQIAGMALYLEDRRRRSYFYLARVTPTVTKTDVLRGPR